MGLTEGVLILKLATLYNNSFWIKETGRPKISTAHPLAVMKARLLCWAYRTYTKVQGCPLQCFLHVPQEAAGGSKRGGSKLVLSGKAPLSFFPAPCVHINSNFPLNQVGVEMLLTWIKIFIYFYDISPNCSNSGRWENSKNAVMAARSRLQSIWTQFQI